MAQTSYSTITITDITDIDHIQSWYLAYNNNTGVTINTPGWTTNTQSADATISALKPFLWTYDIYYGDAAGTVILQTTSPRVIGTYSTDGRGISQINQYYAIYSTNTGVDVDTTREIDDPDNPGETIEVSIWSSTCPNVTPEEPYLWYYEEILYTNNTSDIIDPFVIGNFSKGISTIEKWYGISALNIGIEYPDDEDYPLLSGGWQLIPPLMTEQYPYLWYCQITTYNDVSISPEIAGPYVIGTYGRTGPKGDKGEAGEQGAPGASVTDSTPLYYLKLSDSAIAPTIDNSFSIVDTDVVNAWTTVIPTYQVGGIYYTCLRTILDTPDSVPFFSEVVQDYSLTDSKQRIQGLEIKTRKIIENSSGLTIVGGTDSFDSLDINTYGYNSIAAPDYIALRYNDKKLMQLNGNTIILHSSLRTDAQGNIIEGAKALEINQNGLNIYKPDSLNPALELTRQSLNLYNPTNNSLGLQLTGNALNLYDPSSGNIAVQLNNGDLSFYNTVNGTAKKIATYGSSIDIGDESGFHIHIGTEGENGQIGFYYGANPVAYINTEQLYIKRSVVLNEMLVGEKEVDGEKIALWAWRYDATDDSIYLKWLGE